MKYSSKLSDAVHILAFIELLRDRLRACMPPKLTSGEIARSIHTNASFVRQLMMQLRKAGLLVSERGAANPRLGRPAEEISLYDIYRAVEGNKPLLHLDENVNEMCVVGVHIQLALQESFDSIQKAAEEEMRSITLAKVIEDYHKRLPEEADEKPCFGRFKG